MVNDNKFAKFSQMLPKLENQNAAKSLESSEMLPNLWTLSKKLKKNESVQNQKNLAKPVNYCQVLKNFINVAKALNI